MPPTTEDQIRKYSHPEYHWVDTDDQLRSVVHQWFKAGTLAIDMEADSFFNYPEKVCLIQVSTTSDNWLLDPLAIRDMSPFKSIIEHREVLKVFHDADYDIRCFHRQFKIRPRHLFDTKIAGEMTGEDRIGLGALLEKFFGVIKEAKYQRFDWSRRPLPAAAAAYAVTDSVLLIPLKKLLEDSVRKKHRLDWLQQEFRHLETLRWAPGKNSSLALWNPSQVRRMTPLEYTILESLWSWRERTGLSGNIPPTRIISNSDLFQVARSVAAGNSWKEKIPKGRIHRYSRSLERCIQKALQTPVQPPPQRASTDPPRLLKHQEKRMEMYRKVRNKAAETLGIPGSLIATKSQLLRLACLAAPGDMDTQTLYESTELRAWQWEIIRQNVTPRSPASS